MIYIYDNKENKYIHLYRRYIQKGPKNYISETLEGEFKESLSLNKGTVTRSVKRIKNIQQELKDKMDKEEDIKEKYKEYLKMFNEYSTGSKYTKTPTSFNDFKKELVKYNQIGVLK